MDGAAYVFGFLVPASVLIFCGYYLAAQCNGTIKISAGLQIDMRTRNKMIKKRGLQIGLFIKVIAFKLYSNHGTTLLKGKWYQMLSTCCFWHQKHFLIDFNIRDMSVN